MRIKSSKTPPGHAPSSSKDIGAASTDPYETVVQDIHRRADVLLDRGASAVGAKSSLDTVLSHWKGLLKNIVLPIFIGMCLKSLREWLEPGKSTQIIELFERQALHMTGDQRREQVYELALGATVVPIYLVKALLDVMAHVYAFLMFPTSDSNLEEVRSPVTYLNFVLTSSHAYLGPGEQRKTLTIVLPGLVRLLNAASEGKALPEKTELQAYLQHFMTADNYQIMKVVMPNSLAWLPDFIWGWAALADDLGTWIDAVRAERGQADLMALIRLEPERFALKVLELALQTSLKHLVIDALRKRFPGIVMLVEGTHAQATAIMQALEQAAARVDGVGLFLNQLAMAFQAFLQRPAFPSSAGANEQLNWGFALLTDPQMQRAFGLLLPEQLAEPIHLAAEVGASVTALPVGTPYSSMVRQTLESIEQSPYRHIVDEQLPVPLTTWVERHDYWEPLVKQIAEPDDPRPWARVTGIGYAIMQIAAREANAYARQAYEDETVINDVLVPMATCMYFLYTGTRPGNYADVAKVVVEEIISRYFPDAYAFWNAVDWVRSVVNYLVKIHRVWHIYTQPYSVERQQALLDWIATNLDGWAFSSQQMTELLELMTLLPPLLGLIAKDAEKSADNNELSRLTSVLDKLHNSTNPLVQGYVRRIKLLVICKVTGASEDIIAPYVPLVPGSDPDLDKHLAPLGLAGPSFISEPVYSQPTAPRTWDMVMSGWERLGTWITPTYDPRSGKRLANILGGNVDGSPVTEVDLSHQAPTTPEDLEQRNSRANHYVYAGAGALGGALVLFSLAGYWHYQKRKSAAPSSAPAQSDGLSDDIELGSRRGSERQQLFVPEASENPHDGQSVYRDTVHSIPAQSWAEYIKEHKVAFALGGGALAASVGASLVAYGTYQHMSDDDISSAIGKPQGHDLPVINEVEKSLAQYFDLDDLADLDDLTTTTAGFEKEILRLGLVAGYIPSAAEISASPLLQEVISELHAHGQGEALPSQAARFKRSLSEETDLQAEADKEEEREESEDDDEEQDDDGAPTDVDSPQQAATPGNIGVTSGGQDLLELASRERIPLTDLARVTARDVKTEKFIKDLLVIAYEDHLNEKPTIPAHLINPQSFAKFIGDSLYEKHEHDIPPGDPTHYDPERLRAVNVEGLNKSTWPLTLNILTLGILSSETKAARDRNPYNYGSMTATDGRWTINDDLEISEFDLLTGKLHESSGAVIHTSGHTGTITYPEPTELFKDMTHYDLEEAYTKEILPLFDTLRPALEGSYQKTIYTGLQQAIGLQGYNPEARIKAGLASVHDVQLYEDPTILISDQQGRRSRKSDVLRNVIGYVDAAYGFSFFLFLDSNEILDMHQASRAPRVAGEQPYDPFSQGHIPVRTRVRDYAALTQIMAATPQHSDLLPSNFIARRVPPEELKRVKPLVNSDGTPLYNAAFIKAIEDVQASAGVGTDGVDLALGPLLTVDQLAQHHVARVKADLLKNMDFETRSKNEQNSIFVGDVIALITGMLAATLALLSLIALPIATPLAIGSAIAAAISAASSNIPRIVHAENIEDKAYHKRVLAAALALELVGLGLGIKAGSLLVAPRKLHKLSKKLIKRLSATQEELQKAKIAKKAALNAPQKKAADTTMRTLAKQRKKLKHQEKVLAKQQKFLERPTYLASLQKWVERHPERWENIQQDALGEVLAPFIVGTAMGAGGDIIEMLASFDRTQFKEALDNPTSSFQGAPLYGPTGISPSVYHPLLVNPGERYALDRVRLAVMDERPGDRTFEYRRLPRGVMPLSEEERESAPTPTAAIGQTDRWIRQDPLEILGPGAYRLIGVRLYKRAVSAHDLSPDLGARSGLYAMQNEGGFVHEKLVQAFGHDVPLNVQNEGVAISDPIARSAYFDQAARSGKYFPTKTTTELKTIGAATALAKALSSALAADSHAYMIKNKVLDDSELWANVPGSQDWHSALDEDRAMLIDAGNIIDQALGLSTRVRQDAAAQPTLANDLAKYDYVIAELLKLNEELLETENLLADCLSRQSALKSLYELNQTIRGLRDKIKSAETENARLDGVIDDFNEGSLTHPFQESLMDKQSFLKLLRKQAKDRADASQIIRNRKTTQDQFAAMHRELTDRVNQHKAQASQFPDNFAGILRGLANWLPR